MIPQDVLDQYKDKITALSIKLGCAKEEIMGVFEKSYTQVSGLSYPDQVKVKLAWNSTLSELSKVFGSTRSPAVPYYVFPFGESGLYDTIETRWKPHSIKIGAVAPDGTPLDCRETIFGRENPNKGMPYGDPEYEREIYALVSKDKDFNKVEIATLLARGDTAIDLNVKLWKFYQARFTERIPKNRDMAIRTVLNITAGTRFLPLDTNLQGYELLNKIDVMTVEQLRDYAKLQRDTPSFRQPIIAVEGMVVRVGRVREDKNTRSVIISDEYLNQVVCSLPVFLPFPYVEGSEVVMFGTVVGMEDRELLIGVGYIPKQLAIIKEEEQTQPQANEDEEIQNGSDQ